MYSRIGILALMSFVLLPGCDEGQDCVSHADTYCQDDVTYWMDGCGNFEEVVENCDCGCTPDHAGCNRCNCTCADESSCCDGCLPFNQGGPCDDEDPDTRLDVCQDGVCAGWGFSVASPALPRAPAEPDPVRLSSWTCPAGWNASAHGELADENGDPFSWCTPPPLPRLKLGAYVTPLGEGEQPGDRPICEPEIDGTYPVLGQADCRPLGEPCPLGDWPDIPAEVTGTRIYVKAGAGGDGTQASPFSTVGEAVAAASAGDVVVIAAGTYSESLSPNEDLTLWGACVRQTILDAPGPHAGVDGGAVVIGSDVSVTLRNLQIKGEQNGVRVRSAGAVAVLSGVWIHQATRYGLCVRPGSARLDGVLVDSTRPEPGLTGGYGITVQMGADVLAAAATFEQNREMGIFASNGGTTLGLTDVAVRNTQGQEASGAWGRGLNVQGGARATVSRSLFDSNRDVGVFAAQSGSEILMTDVVVQNTHIDLSDDSGGIGLEILQGGRVDCTRGLFSGNRYLGVLYQDAGSGGTLEDVIIRDTESRAVADRFGRGLQVVGAQVTCRRALLERNRDTAILAAEDAVLDLEDLAVLDTRTQKSDDKQGKGAHFQSRSLITIARALFLRNHDAGIKVSTQGTNVEMEDVIIRDTLPRGADQLFGRGLQVELGASLRLSRGRLEGNHAAGIVVLNPGTTVALEDVTVRDTHCTQADGSYGEGLYVMDGSRVTLQRGWFEQNHAVGILVQNEGSQVELTDATVQDTQPQEAGGLWGRGLEVGYGAQVRLVRGHFLRNHDAGILAGSAGTVLQMEDVTVQDTRDGADPPASGTGLGATNAAEVIMTRGLFEGNRMAGIVLSGAGTQATLEDIEVKDTRGEEVHPWGGGGLQLSGGAAATCSRGLFSGNHEIGVVAFDPNTRLFLRQVQIENTLPRECAVGDPPSCPDIPAGTGMGTFGAPVAFEALQVSGSATAGIQIGYRGTLHGTGLGVFGNPIGVNIQDAPPDYDFFEAVKGLLMEDNAINFDSTSLSVPDALENIEIRENES